MIMNPKITEMWDTQLKPLMEELYEECPDALTKWHINNIAAYVEHDLADDRPPGFRFGQFIGVLGSKTFLSIFNDHQKYKERLIECRELIDRFIAL